jgi:hypothetical protein
MTMTFRQEQIYMGGKMESRSISPYRELVSVARYIIVVPQSIHSYKDHCGRLLGCDAQ